MKSTTDPVLVLDTDLGVSNVIASSQIIVRRESLLSLARHLPAITDKPTADEAVGLLRDMKQHSSLIEEARKIVKAPVLALSKAIDAKADELAGEVNTAFQRISRELGQWNMAQEQLRLKAEREAQEEATRILAEAQKKIEHAQDHSRTPESAAAKTAKIEEKAMADIAANTEALVSPFADKKTSGTATRTVVEYEVEDIQAFYRAFPMMCEIKPKDGILKSYLKDLKPGTVVPGVRFWKSAATSIRG